MKYLNKFSFPSKDAEFEFFKDLKRQCYTNFYPFQVLSEHEKMDIEFDNVTIFYGGNGSGKTTALNIIAEKLNIARDSNFNKSNFYSDYLRLCDYEIWDEISDKSRIITSDDVFDFAMNLRHANDGIDTKREDVFQDYLDSKYANFQMNSLEDYDTLKKINRSRSVTQSKYTRENLMKNIRTHSNGENAFRYFTEKLEENGLYLLDEPENSLSPKLQLELKKFIEDSARYFGCQIIMATHSPFLLSIEGAKVYDFDEAPIEVKPWNQLENITIYHNFFKKNGRKIEGND